MAKIVLTFLIVFILFFIGIKAVMSLTGKEFISLTRVAFYSIICSALTVLVLTLFVLLF